MTEFNNLPEEIFDLMKTASFESLSEKQKTLVLSHFSEEEYRDYHDFLVQFSEADNRMKDSVHSKLSEISDDQNSQGIRKSSISIWHALIAVVLASLISFFVGRSTSDTDCSSAELPVIFAQQDTLGKSLAEDNYPEQLVISF